MLHILLFLVLNISPAIQSQQLFVASGSLFKNLEKEFHNQIINFIKPKP
jgi:hypothetical protein